MSVSATDTALPRVNEILIRDQIQDAVIAKATQAAVSSLFHGLDGIRTKLEDDIIQFVDQLMLTVKTGLVQKKITIQKTRVAMTEVFSELKVKPSIANSEFPVTEQQLMDTNTYKAASSDVQQMMLLELDFRNQKHRLDREIMFAKAVHDKVNQKGGSQSGQVPGGKDRKRSIVPYNPKQSRKRFKNTPSESPVLAVDGKETVQKRSANFRKKQHKYRPRKGVRRDQAPSGKN